MTTHATDVQPINKSVIVPLPVEKAFQLFTDGIGTWWPLATHSIEGENAETVVFDAEAGRVYERTPDGAIHDWGLVKEWDPPRRFVLDWVVNPSRPGTDVEVRFSAEDGQTRVDLEHRNWDRRGADERGNYDTGWDYVLGKFVGAAD